MLTDELLSPEMTQPQKQCSFPIVVSATFTVEPIQESTQYWMRELGMQGEVRLAPYDQVFQQLLDENSLVSRNHQGINVHCVRIEDWWRLTGKQTEVVERSAHEFAGAVRQNAARFRTNHMVCLCPDSVDALNTAEYAAFSQSVSRSIVEDLADEPGVYTVTMEELQAVYPVRDYADPSADKLGHMPYTPEFFTALGTMVARKVHALKVPRRKVIVLDCDQTLWQGVCGEDGAGEIVIDPARKSLQEFLIDQQSAGMLLCLCSKNNESDVWDVFDHQPQMLLKRDHLVAWRINWQAKSENLWELAAELKLGLDSFIFIDDNPVECAEVEARCPEVLTLHLPAVSEQIPRVLRHAWAFDHLRLTEEDRRRTALYQEEVRREQFHLQSPTFEAFLDGLELRINIAPLESGQLSRVSQLTQRTNQFNFTTIRRSEAEIQQIVGANGMEAATVEVSDRFGDYGLVGAMIYACCPDAIAVDTFLLSCRVLGKGVEHQMFRYLGEKALACGLSHVDVDFVQTARNRPAFDFLNHVAPAVSMDDGQRIHHRFSAADAATARFSTRVPPNVETSASEQSRTQASAAVSSSALARIARDMWEPAQILRSIENARRIKRPSNLSPSLAPRDALEQQLVQLWEKLFGILPVGIHDDFFALGGNSLLAVRLFAQIKRLTGKDLPLVTLFQAPTIQQLAAILRQQGWESPWASLVPIKPGGSKPPFYCVHGVGGNILEYLDLAKYIDEDQPFYGLQAIGLDGRRPIENLSVEQMASRYLEEIRGFQPCGPYHLGGSSFGGLVAYEMAQQLTAQGEPVGLLALFDTNGPDYPRHLPSRTTWKRKWDWWLDRIQLHWQNFVATEGRAKLTYVREKAERWKRQTRWKVQAWRHRVTQRIEQALWPHAIKRVHKTGYRAAKNYSPRPYVGDVTLFRAMEQPRGIHPDRTLGWNTLVRGALRIYDTPGHHGAIVREPRSRVLAAQLTEALTRARTAAEPAGISPVENRANLPNHGENTHAEEGNSLLSTKH